MILFGLTERATQRLRELHEEAGAPRDRVFRLETTDGGEGLRLDSEREGDVVFTVGEPALSLHMDPDTANANSGNELDYNEADGRLVVVSSTSHLETTHWLSPEPRDTPS